MATNDTQTHRPEEPRTYPAEKARQGEIVLRSRASRIIFIAALAAAIVLAALSLIYGPSVQAPPQSKPVATSR